MGVGVCVCVSACMYDGKRERKKCLIGRGTRTTLLRDTMDQSDWPFLLIDTTVTHVGCNRLNDI
jgi:hypothetical protein